MTAIASVAGRGGTAIPSRFQARTTGLAWLMAAEVGASAMGFTVLVHWARAMGPAAFAHVEYAAAVAAWLLVIVRGGAELIVYREAARRPRLVHSFTEILIGIRCACAIVGYAIVLAVAWLVGRERGGAVTVAGLALLPSAFVADVGPRATGRLGWIALAQAVRAVAYAAAGFCLVSGSSHILWAAACGVLCEMAGWLVPFAQHALRYGLPRPRFRRRASAVLAHRAAIASLIRFGRVSLYGADILVLGWWAGAELGPYAAARRSVFALVALGLVVPSAVAPAIARAWMAGEAQARAFLENVSTALWALALPACVGLALTAGRWLPLLFGHGYRAGAPWLVLVVARLPWLLSASLSQTALVACRRETTALKLVFGLSALAAVLVPLLAASAGPAGVGSAALVVELVGACGGWLLLNRLGVAPTMNRRTIVAVVGALVLAIVCLLLRRQPLAVVCVSGVIAYAVTWGLGERLLRRVPASGGRVA
jgi:O-antigen/teichoic acid export membrane protein